MVVVVIMGVNGDDDVGGGHSDNDNGDDDVGGGHSDNYNSCNETGLRHRVSPCRSAYFASPWWSLTLASLT